MGRRTKSPLLSPGYLNTLPLDLTPVLDSSEGIDPVDHVGHVLLEQLSGGGVAVEVQDVTAV